jgi:hypothetical protein
MHGQEHCSLVGFINKLTIKRKSMSDHEFEKQVQQKMDELKLPPSDAVWQTVERKLHKEKRRRRMVLWLPLLLLGLTLAGYVILQNSANKTSPAGSVSRNSLTVKDNVPAVERDQSRPAPLVIQDRETYENSVSKEYRKDNKVATSSGYLKKNKQNQELLQAARGQLNGKKLTTGKRPIHNQAVEPSMLANYPLNNHEPIRENNITTLQGIDTEPYGKLLNINIIEVDKNPHEEKEVFSEQKNIAANNLIYPKKTIAHAGKNHWKWGIEVNAGLSKIIDGGFFNLLEKSTVADVASYSSQFPSTNPGGVATPSAIASGFGYSAGGFLEKQLSKKIDFSIGINYSRFNTEIHVGQEVDSPMVINNGSSAQANVSGFYREAGSKEYHNHYDYIVLPAELHVKIGRNVKVPLYWNAGLSISRFISTNSLHYDGTSRIYYKDDNLFNKTQIGISSGFSVKGMEKNKFPFVIGPSIQYNVTNLLKKQVHGNNHLLFVSLDMKLLLKN